MSITLNDLVLRGRATIEDRLPAQHYNRTKPKLVWFCDAPTQERFGDVYSTTQAELAEQGLYHLCNVEVRGRGLMTVDGQVVMDNLEGAPKDIARAAGKEMAPPNVVVDSPVLYVMRYGVKNYGHWLTDILPRIMWFRERHPDTKVVVHAETPRQIRRALDIAGVSGKDVVTLGDEHALIKNMYFVGPWNKHPLTHSGKSFEYLSCLKKRVMEKNVWRFSRRPKKLFVTRDDAATRHAVNGKDLVRLLRAKGYVSMACGNSAFDEQVRIFAAAEKNVALSGAALSNVVFCEAGAEVFNISSAVMPSLYFWDLSHHRRLDYSIAYFPATQLAKGIHSDMTVDLDVMAELVS